MAIKKVGVGKFVGGARAYICAYFELNQQQQNQDQVANDNISERQQAHFVDIERITKSFKTHWCALDFDSGFIALTCVHEEWWSEVNKEWWGEVIKEWRSKV